MIGFKYVDKNTIANKKSISPTNRLLKSTILNYPVIKEHMAAVNQLSYKRRNQL